MLQSWKNDISQQSLCLLHLPQLFWIMMWEKKKKKRKEKEKEKKNIEAEEPPLGICS